MVLSAESTNGSRARKVLLVERRQMVAMALVNWLDRVNCNVLGVVSTKRDALQFCKREAVDVIFIVTVCPPPPRNGFS